MGKTRSPLRYPGGKSKIYDNIRRLIEANEYADRIYVEPYAGGFGVGIALLENNIVHQAVMNDLDTHIFHFWDAVFNNTEELIHLITETEISLVERDNQKAIYSNPDALPLEDAFATLFLNRVNYSGVLFAGPIGGKDQKSEYPLGCRFNKNTVIDRIRLAASLKDRVELYHEDACTLIPRLSQDVNHQYFFNIDPPYVLKGKSLYSEYYTEEMHRQLERVIRDNLHDIPWIVTYDNCELILDIYRQYHIQEYGMFHSAHNRVYRKELVISPEELEQFA